MQQELTQLVVKSTLSCESLFKMKEWCVCAVSLEDETSKALLVKIIELWLTIRGSFFPLLGLMSNNYYCVSHCTCIIIIVNQDCCYTLLLTVFLLACMAFWERCLINSNLFCVAPSLAISSHSLTATEPCTRKD